MLRGSWSESFRAPDMQRAFLEEVQGYTSGIDYYAKSFLRRSSRLYKWY